MIIKKYQMEELDKAREIQKEAVKLHLPAPPVLSYTIDVVENDKVKERIESKANSYTRNALNLLAHNLGFAYGGGVNGFTEGYISWKQVGGNISEMFKAGGMWSTVSASTGANLQIYIGSSDAPESLDAYNIDNIVNTGSTNVERFSYYDETTKKQMTYLSVIKLNTGAGSVDVKELGIVGYVGSPYATSGTGGGVGYFLLVRDVLPSPVTLANGASMRITYKTEVLFPEA